MGMEIIISVILLLVGIAVLVIIHVCIVSRAFGRNNRSNGGVNINVAQGATIITSTSVSRDDIKKLPSFRYMVEDEDDVDVDVDVEDVGSSGGSQYVSSLEMVCAVCLENFRVGEECRLLPKCKHCFHAECIDSWLLKAAVCPICRTEAISQTLGVHDRNQIEVAVVEFV